MLLDIVYITLLTVMAGAFIPLGGLLASLERLSPGWLEQEFRHFLIALGGGILLGAVAVVLVPQGKDSMGDSLWAIPAIIFGGLLFFIIERVLGLKRRESPQLMGVMLDFIPEATALGGLAIVSPSTAWLLAILIALQNLPEGFNAYRELCDLGYTSRKTLAFMTVLVGAGPLAGLSGYFLLSGQPVILGAIMLIASGGILYLIFQDIAPQSRLDRHWGPPLGAVIGFCVALFSHDVMVHF
ncbi:MAG: divalent cation transporter [Gammaproteobacteria bacterium]|uniref:ZIP zinc transporter family protein n=2 Tax=Marinobacter nitratireducens TaxID=1137280 RepID=A0A072N4R5_9GAMM|nr:ZIP zinc transporter family protein [Marinobacter nitratireducens]TNE75231.1 MAG: divalent cation transporter [Gammaproteobacteria bacterium]TNE96991.1 MAG: divalent cation transporter [Gammaproteobacteria bacterium]